MTRHEQEVPPEEAEDVLVDEEEIEHYCSVSPDQINEENQQATESVLLPIPYVRWLQEGSKWGSELGSAIIALNSPQNSTRNKAGFRPPHEVLEERAEEQDEVEE